MPWRPAVRRRGRRGRASATTTLSPTAAMMAKKASMKAPGVGYRLVTPSGPTAELVASSSVTICVPTAVPTVRNTWDMPFNSAVRSCGATSTTRFGIAA